MERITITLPTSIPAKKAKYVMEEHLRKSSKYTCEITFEKFEDDENVFSVKASTAEAFYLIGLMAGVLIQKYT